jgi:hypothetical protein
VDGEEKLAAVRLLSKPELVDNPLSDGAAVVLRYALCGERRRTLLQQK